MAPSPVVARWELSRRLSGRRRELKVDVATITTALGFTRNYWSAVEHDRTLIAEEKLRLLFDVLEFEPPEQARLLELRQAARARGWWDNYSMLEEAAKRFYGMEAGADYIRVYDGHMIPGLLQTEEYTRAIVEIDPIFSALETETAVQIRTDRQKELRQRPEIELCVMLSEAALRQQVGGPELQAQQLEHLITLAEPSDLGIELRILPFASNPGIVSSSSTMLFFEFRNPALPIVAWQEAVRLLGSVTAGDPQFSRLDLAWRDGARRALGHEASVAMVNEIRGSL